jgi:hypothetical protein
MNVLPVLDELNTSLPDEQRQTLMQTLAAYLNGLLLHDFPALVQLLYKVDVPEKMLKDVLLDNPGKDAGDLIARLLVERQRQKIASRQAFRGSAANESGEEKW